MYKDEKEQMGLNLRNDMWRAIRSIQAERWEVDSICMNFEAWDLYCYTMYAFDRSSFWDTEHPRFMGYELKLGAELCAPMVHQDLPLFPTLEKMAELESVPDVRVTGKAPARLINYTTSGFYENDNLAHPIVYRHDPYTDTVSMMTEPLQDMIIEIKLRSGS